MKSIAIAEQKMIGSVVRPLKHSYKRDPGFHVEGISDNNDTRAEISKR